MRIHLPGRRGKQASGIVGVVVDSNQRVGHRERRRPERAAPAERQRADVTAGGRRRAGVRLCHDRRLPWL